MILKSFISLGWTVDNKVADSLSRIVTDSLSALQLLMAVTGC